MRACVCMYMYIYVGTIHVHNMYNEIILTIRILMHMSMLVSVGHWIPIHSLYKAAHPLLCLVDCRLML